MDIMKEIQLTQKQVALVDDCDFERLNSFKWYARKHSKTFYAGRMSPWINGTRYLIQMHYEVIGMPPDGLMTDHKNGCGIDNRRDNLRFVTSRQNCQNRKNIKKTSKHPGVYWREDRKKWIARIRIKGKSKYLGQFTDEKEAFTVYSRAINCIGEKVIGE